MGLKLQGTEIWGFIGRRWPQAGTIWLESDSHGAFLVDSSPEVKWRQRKALRSFSLEALDTATHPTAQILYPDLFLVTFPLDFSFPPSAQGLQPLS